MSANGSWRWSPTRARSPKTRPSWSRSSTSRCRPWSIPRRRSPPTRRSSIPSTARTCSIAAKFVWGPVEEDFAAARADASPIRARWHRSATVPIETFGVVAHWDPRRGSLDVWASIQMPKFPDQLARALRLPGNAVRVHFDVDVGGSYGVQARLEAQRARRISRAPHRRAGAADRGPAREYARRRRARPRPHLRRRRWRSTTTASSARMKMRALDDVGAYAGRAPLQLGKPVGAIVGPYRINSVAVRADQRHHQQDAAGGGARLRPGADQFRDRDRRSICVAARAGHGPDRAAPPQPHPRRRVSLRDPERQHL